MFQVLLGTSLLLTFGIFFRFCLAVFFQFIFYLCFVFFFLCKVLFGKVSPAGRMVQTLYPASVQHELSIFDMNMRPGPSKFPRPDGQGCRPVHHTL